MWARIFVALMELQTRSCAYAGSKWALSIRFLGIEKVREIFDKNMKKLQKNKKEILLKK